ncbi:MAG TPA: hypothetical protein VFU86_08690 [Terriglobales bacterium]|nr:hypothetical protein [Terriglobales bacterium]
MPYHLGTAAPNNIDALFFSRMLWAKLPGLAAFLYNGRMAKDRRAALPVVAVLLMLCVGARAQSTQSPDLPDAPSAQQAKESKPKPSGGRVFGIVPEFNVTSIKDAKPLTAKGKWRLFVKQTVDPFTFVGAAFTSGLGQATDSFHDYGQGWAGYGERFGAAAADSVDGSLWGGFIFPVIFKQDPRYFRLGDGSIKHRIGYSISRIAVTRTDSGHHAFNFSEVLGNLVAGGIANAYYPQADRGVGLTFQRAGVVTGLGALGKIGQEFLPDIDRKFFHRQGKAKTSGQ